MRVRFLAVIGLQMLLGGCAPEIVEDARLASGVVDLSGQPSPTVSSTAMDRVVEPPAGWTLEPDGPEDCSNGIDDDDDNRSDCADTECWTECGCLGGPGDRVLWYRGNGAPPVPADTPFINQLLGMGAAAVSDTTTWPPSGLMDYRVVLLILPTVNFDPVQKADIASFVAAGGTLVLAGDGAGFSSGYAAVYGDLNPTLGTTTVWQTLSLDSGCDKTATVVAAHALTDGYASFIYAYGTDLILSGGAQELVIGESGQTLLAVENDIVMITDVNPLIADCTVAPGNQQLWRNLWNASMRPGADSDLDGVHDFCDYCPGFDDLVDSDSDGEPDACDVCPGFADDIDLNGDGVPDVEIDTDQDGTPDVCDICPLDNPDDADGDGECDSGDACVGFDDVIDSDGDGTADGCDPCPVDVADDSDADGVCDSDDLCPDFDDAVDGDGDGSPDGCDPCPLDLLDDSDLDGICDSDDLCVGFDDNADMDGDGAPDGCDPCPADAADDSDLDGSCDSDDLCPGFDDNLDQDLDGAPDSCDPCPADALDDSDGDGVCDSDDICPGFDDSADGDGDGSPNACDPCPFDNPDDSDGDGVCDGDDICVGDDLVDQDSDGLPDDCDLCPTSTDNIDSDADGVCEPDDRCAGFDDKIDGDGDGQPDGCDPCPLDNPDDNDGDGVCNGVDNTPDGDPSEEGCGCDSGSGPAGWLPLILLGMALWRRGQ